MYAVAEVAPAMPQAGLLFDALVGPWVEHVGPTRFRLSPLLHDSGEAGLAEDKRTSIRTAVVEHLMLRRPFPADHLMLMFLFAFRLKHVAALTWFSGALIHTAHHDKNLFRRLAEEISVFALVDRGEAAPLFPENIKVSTMLRYAQFRVAAATEDGKRAAKVLNRLLFEIEQLKGALKSNTLKLALLTALMERAVPLRPKRWFDMLLSLYALPDMQRALNLRPSRSDPYSGLTLSASHDEMIFIIRATALRGIDELGELVEVLESQPAAIRDRYLIAASNQSQGVGHIVSSAWLSAVRSEGFDAKAAAAKLLRLGEIASHWKNADMAIELACAQAVILDEYSSDKDGALRALHAAQAKYPHDYRINRQRQKVYYRNGDHALALAEFETFRSAFTARNPVDRTFAMREAGRSAAEIGDLDKTRDFFEQAWQSGRKCGEHMRPMTAGLSADCAILDFQAGKTGSALSLMLRALMEEIH